MSSIIISSFIASLLFANQPNLSQGSHNNKKKVDYGELVTSNQVGIKRKGTKIYISVPMKDAWNRGYANEVFETAQSYAKLILTDWIKKANSLQSQEDILDSLNLDSDQMIELFRRQNITLPDPHEIIRNANNINQVNQQIKALNEIHFSVDDLAEAFSHLQLQYEDETRSLPLAAVPDVFLIFGSFKIPRVAANVARKVPHIGDKIAHILNGSVTVSVALRLWKIEVFDAKTLIMEDSKWYAQSSTKLWLNIDTPKNTIQADTSVRYGVGAFWGDFEDIHQLQGYYLGPSFDVMMRQDARGNLRGFNIKAGGVFESISTLGKGNNFIDHKYIMLSRQRFYGVNVDSNEVENSSASSWSNKLPLWLRHRHWNAGYLISLANLTSHFKSPSAESIVKNIFSEENLNLILKEMEDEGVIEINPEALDEYIEKRSLETTEQN